MANEPLEVVFTVDDETMAGLKSAIGNIQDGVKTINTSVTKGMSQTMGSAEQIMRTRTGSIMMLMTRLIARIVQGFDTANSQVVATFYKYQEGTNIAKDAMMDLALNGGAGLGELGKNIASINQELGNMFGANFGQEAESVLSSLTTSMTKLGKDTGVSLSTMAGGFRALVCAGYDTQQAMDVVTKTVLTGNGSILDSFKRIGTESPENIKQVTNAWVNQLGGIQAVQGATQNYMEQNRTFSENMASLWNTVLVALQPLIESLNRVSSYILPYIQQGLLAIRAVLDALPNWVKDVGMFVLLVTVLGNVVNFVASQFTRFGGILSVICSGFMGLGKVALFPFMVMMKGLQVVATGFVKFFEIVKNVMGVIGMLFTVTGFKVALIAGAVVTAGVIMYNAFQPFHDMICWIIGKLKQLLGLLGKKVKGAVGGFKKGLSSGMKAPKMPQMPKFSPSRNPGMGVGKAPRSSGGGKSKAPKTPKSGIDKARDKALKAQQKASERQKKIEADLTRKMQDEFNKRKDAYMNFVGFFEGVNRRVVGISNIIKNVKSQEQALADFSEGIRTLQARLGDGETAQAFIAELQKLGPASVDEIQALATCSDDELNQVVSAYQNKSKLASDLAGDEVAKLKPKFKKEIEDANKTGITQFDIGGKGMDKSLNASMGKINGSLNNSMANLDRALGSDWGEMNTTTGGGLSDIVGTSGNGIRRVVEVMKEKLNAFKTVWNNYWGKYGLGGGISRGFGWLIGFAVGLVGRLLASIGRALLSPGLSGTGEDLIHGLWRGICNAGNWLKRMISHFCDGVIDGFKKAFLIHSPSRRTKVLGDFLAQGLAVGMDKGYDKHVDGIIYDYKDRLESGYRYIQDEVGAMYSNELGSVSGTLKTNSIYTNGVTVSINNCNIQEQQDIEKLALEIARVNNRQMLALGRRY